MEVTTRIFFTFIIIYSNPIFANEVDLKRDLNKFDFDFVAPSVNGEPAVTTVQSGTIIYDTTVDQFKGLDNSQWTPLGAGSTTIDATATSSGTVTISTSDESIHVFSPSTTGLIVKLDSDFSGGEEITIVNDSTTDTLEIQDSAGTKMRVQEPGTSSKILCIVASSSSCSTKSHWELMGKVETEWTSFTPTGAWNTNSTYTGYWKRIGDTLKMDVSISLSGAPNSGSLDIDLPSNMTIDTTKLSSTNTSGGKALGYGTTLESGIATHTIIAKYIDTTSVRVFAVSSSGTEVIVNNSSPFTYGNNDVLNIVVSVPLSEWDE